MLLFLWWVLFILWVGLLIDTVVDFFAKDTWVEIDHRDAEIAKLRVTLRCILRELENNTVPSQDEDNPTPKHLCGFQYRPDLGYCDFCEWYWTAKELLGELPE